jgi:Putative metallopeptidase
MRRLGPAAAVAVVLAGLSLTMAACGGGDGTNRSEAYKPPKGGGGAFVLEEWGPARPQDRFAYKVFKIGGVMGAVTKQLNNTFELPRDIDVVMASTNIGPAYVPDRHTIYVGYPFINTVFNTFSQAYPNITPGQLGTKTAQVMAFVLYHEIGHALIDQLHIPQTGREEDAVDNLATVINVQDNRNGGQFALSFADFFSLLQQAPSSLTVADFWDEHSLDAQRAFDVVCHVYGSDPQAYKYLASFIPPERRVRCPDEWKQISSSWNELLAPHEKQSGDASQ